MYAEERQQAMAQAIGQEGRLSVAQLAETFDVTTETVRRDLSSLERIGLVRRVHGGAVPASSLSVIESGLGERDQANTGAKDAIAAAAVQQLPPPGSVVILDAGSTTGAPRRRAPPRAPAHRRHPRGTDRGAAGRSPPHRAPPAARPGPTHHPRRRRGRHRGARCTTLRADLAFLATNGLSADFGLTTPDRDEAATKRAIAAAARRTVVLADSSKIGVETSQRFATLADVDVLVTDNGITDDARRALEKAGLEVVVA